MYMEHSAEDSLGVVDGKKPRSLDLQTLYDQDPGLPYREKQYQKDPVKRKSSLVEDTCHAKKKSKKEVLLRSLASGKNTKKSLEEECEGGSRSGSGSGSIDSSKPEGSGQGRISDNAKEIGGVSLNHGGDSTQIPKRRREMIRRKKVDDNQGLKMSSATVSSGDMLLSVGLKGRLNGNEMKNSNVSTNEETNGNLDQNDMSTRNGGDDEDMKVFRTENFNNDEINRSNKSDLVRRTKKGEGIVLPKRGDSSSVKVKRNYTKRKRTGLKTKDGTVNADPVLDQSVRSHDVSLDDNEENLEANAARMLSSRFNPSCTHFPSNNKTSRSPTPHWGTSSPRARALSGSDTETADRVLRPRDQQRPKGVFRKRRHFYEVFARDLDPHWMLQRKTKVYWPLDQIWYYGKIIGFNPDNNLHHIRYDDQEEEWINLCNERFKLLLFPSELPYNRRRRRAAKEDSRSVKKKNNVDLQENHRKTESEPIISWLSKSSHGNKSPPCTTRKKQKTSKQSDEGRSPSMSLTKNDERKCLDVGSSRKDADECSSNPSLKELPGVLDGRELSLMESSSKPPIVYVRRRFRRKEQGLGDVADSRLSPLPVKSCGLVVSLNCRPDISLSINQRGSSAGWFHCGGLSGSAEDLFPLKLSRPVVAEKVIRFELTRPLFLVPYYCFGLENLALLHAAQMLHYGTLMTLWPTVHLELLFVDDVFGLSFLMFEGCLKQAMVLLFLTLNIFHRPNHEQKRDDEQLPVTSIRFQISFLGDVRKCLVFAFYNFREVGISKWNYMKGKLKKDCFLAKQLAPSECTYENIKVLEYGISHFPVASVLQESSFLGSRKRIRHCLSGDSESRADDNMKQTRIPLSSFSFVAASPFFLDLHLKLLMKRCDPYASHKDQDSIALPLHTENNNIVQKADCSKSGSSWSSHSYSNRLGGISKSASPAEQFSCSRLEARNDTSCAGFEAGGLISRHCHKSPGVDDEVCLTVRKEVAAEPGKCHSSEKTLNSKDHSSTVGTKINHCLVEGIAVEIPPFDPPKGQNGHKSAELANRVIVSGIPSPKASDWRGMLCQSGVGDASLLENLSPLSDRRPDLIASGPKKRRTQVSYSMPVEGQEVGSKFKSNDTKGFPHKRIRRASEKKVLQPDNSGNSHGKMEELYCDVNVLVIAGDHGRREDGAKVVLELFDHSEWRLAVKIRGFTRYSYKAHQFLQCGSTNRYTHAMMWKGGKDWILEFPDRSQWALFKEMHEECYNRNLRVASLKTIPIPGVRLINECDDNGVEKPFARPSPKYYRQIQNDVDIAMDPSNVLYDMDSDDEQWVAKIRSSDVTKSGSVDLSDETFEKIMDMLEKVAYARKKDFFTCDELDDFMVGDESAEEIKRVYEYWREKRQKKGMPLIRHFQPPLWDKYQQQVKEWELATGGHEKAVTSIEKPPMYAFCMKPRGLELVNRGSKHRSQKKISVSGSSMFPVDSEAYQSFGGRRFNGYAYGEETSLHARYNHHGFSDSCPLLQASTRMISREMGSWGYFFSNSDANGRNLYYSKVHGTKSKKIGSSLSPIDQRQVFSPRSPRILGQRRDVNANLPPEWASPRYYYHPDGPHGINVEQLDPSDLDEFRLRDASSAAQHAVNMAKLKREKAQRLLYKADLAIHKAVVALMTAEAIKATAAATTTTTTTTTSSSMEESNRDACSHG